MLAQFGSFLYILVVFVFIILLCYFLLRLMGRVKARGKANANLYLQESIMVGPQNTVQLVRAGDKFLVIGVTREHITLLTELDAEQIKEIEPLPPINTSFKKVLERFMPPKNGQINPNEDDVDVEK